MAYLAKIENNLVVQVIVSDDNMPNKGLDWAIENLGGVWVETFKDQSHRVHFAGIGFTFDPDKGTDGAFIPPKPFESWVLDEDTCLWVAPVPYPEDGESYTWDEDAGDWIAADVE